MSSTPAKEELIPTMPKHSKWQGRTKVYEICSDRRQGRHDGTRAFKENRDGTKPTPRRATGHCWETAETTESFTAPDLNNHNINGSDFSALFQTLTALTMCMLYSFVLGILLL